MSKETDKKNVHAMLDGADTQDPTPEEISRVASFWAKKNKMTPEQLSERGKNAVRARKFRPVRLSTDEVDSIKQID